jgi:1-acyl-sn-glycerol-3-phosphate acyltransferase
MSRMLRFLRAAARLVGILFVGVAGFTTVVILSPLMRPCPRLHERLLIPPRRLFLRSQRRLFGLRIEVLGEPIPPRPFLALANHQSYLDILVLGGVLPTAFISKAEVARWPFVGWLATLASTAYVHRQAPKKRVAEMRSLHGRLKIGNCITGFPEGTTGSGPDLMHLRTGLFEVAREAEVPLLPIAIRYLTREGRELTPEERPTLAWWGAAPIGAHVKQLLLSRGGLARVVIGKPVMPPHPQRRELMHAVGEELRELLEASRSKS